MAGAATEYPDLASVKKVQEIPVVNTVTSSVSQLYSDVKYSNRFASWGLIAVETGFLLACAAVMPLVSILKGPVEFIDVFVCSLIDSAKSRFPVFFKPTEELKRSASKAVITSSLSQATLYSVDKVLLVAQKSVTLLPDVSVEEVAADVNDEDKDGTVSAVTSSLDPLRNLYSTATYPLRTMGQFLHSQRRKVRKLLRKSGSNRANSSAVRGRSRKRVSPRKPSPPRGLIERMVSLPVQALHWIGILAERRTRLKQREDPDLILTSPKARALSSPGSEGDVGNYLEQLNNLEDYISEEDPDYEPGDSDSYSDSDGSTSEEETINISQEIGSPEKADASSPLNKSSEGNHVEIDQQVSPNSLLRNSRAKEKGATAARVATSATPQSQSKTFSGKNAFTTGGSENLSRVKTAPARPLASSTRKAPGSGAADKVVPPKSQGTAPNNRRNAVTSNPVATDKQNASSPNRRTTRSVTSPESSKGFANSGPSNFA